MKNQRFERMARLQRQHHRSNPWRLGAGGLYVPHSYTSTDQEGLSWWDDVGFILNGRRIIVWWHHPRLDYSEEIDAAARAAAGPYPARSGGLLDGATKNYKFLGKAKKRKKIASYSMPMPTAEWLQHLSLIQAHEERISSEGLDLEITPSWKRERLDWAVGVSLVAPLEVRNQRELAKVADLARRLILGHTTLEAEFGAYRYGKTQWLAEQDAQKIEKIRGITTSNSKETAHLS